MLLPHDDDPDAQAQAREEAHAARPRPYYEDEPPDELDDEEAVCDACGQPATCFGSYEGQAAGFACDDCCGHGCEDGYCEPLGDEPDGGGSDDSLDGFDDGKCRECGCELSGEDARGDNFDLCDTCVDEVDRR